MKVFLSYSFRVEDHDLAAQVRETLEDFGFDVQTGAHLGGADLEAEIRRRIQGVDGLVTLLTRRPKSERDEGAHDWVKWELTVAREQGKPAIAVIEKGVRHGGPGRSSEYLEFTRTHLDRALLDLMKKTFAWRVQVGRRLKVQILPPELAAKFKHDERSLQCWLQCYQNGRREDWREIERVQFEDRGAFAYIDVPEGMSFRLKVVEPTGATHTVWVSPVLPCDQLPVTLEL